MNKDSPHLQTFAKYKHFYVFFQKTETLVNFHHEIQAELLNSYRELNDPYYAYNTNCPACVCDFLTTIYRWYENRN